MIIIYLLQELKRFEAHFLLIDLATPSLVTLWSSVALFQALANRLVDSVLFPGTG